MTQALEVGKRLVTLCKKGEFDQAAGELYADDIVSVEGRGTAEMPARMEGIEAIRKKGEWWTANHEIHSMTMMGPFVGSREDQFVVYFDFDVTPKGAERMHLKEVGIYTVKNGKVTQEEFLYLTD